MDKDVRIHIGILLSHKKEWHNAIAVAQIDLEMIILSEISQRQMSYAITYMWGLKYDRNEPISDTKTGQRTFSWFLRGSGDGGGKDWEFGIIRCKLLYIGWINNKVSLQSTGNYFQYPVINHNGKAYEKCM